MEQIWKKIRHNQAIVFGLGLALSVVVWVYGCQSTTASILDPSARVTRAELQVEVDSLLAKAQLKFDSLDRQDQIKSAFFNTAIEYAEGGTINPIAFALTIGNLLGLSAIIDNRRKDVLIKTLKNNVPVDKT